MIWLILLAAVCGFVLGYACGFMHLGFKDE